MLTWARAVLFCAHQVSRKLRGAHRHSMQPRTEHMDIGLRQSPLTLATNRPGMSAAVAAAALRARVFGAERRQDPLVAIMQVGCAARGRPDFRLALLRRSCAHTYTRTAPRAAAAATPGHSAERSHAPRGGHARARARVCVLLMHLRLDFLPPKAAARLPRLGIGREHAQGPLVRVGEEGHGPLLAVGREVRHQRRHGRRSRASPHPAAAPPARQSTALGPARRNPLRLAHGRAERPAFAWSPRFLSHEPFRGKPSRASFPPRRFEEEVAAHSLRQRSSGHEQVSPGTACCCCCTHRPHPPPAAVRGSDEHDDLVLGPCS